MGVLRSALVDLAAARLELLGNCDHFVAEIPQTPTLAFPNNPDDLRVRGYTVLWPTPGAPGPEQALAGGAQVDLEWRFLITCASGLPDYVYRLIDAVDDLFHGWEPTVAGHTVGTCVQDYDPGQPVEGRGFTPSRFYLQMPYRLQVGA